MRASVFRSMIGTVVGDCYKVLRPLGAGGMGVVYLATHVRTQQRVALKVLNATLLGGDREWTQRFHREAQAAAVIRSQHVAAVLDAGVDSATGSPYIVMELLRGEDLASVLKSAGKLAPEVALKIIAQAARGLARAHAAGVVHRDVKPGNLFLDGGEADDLVVKVLDFGIAKTESQDGIKLTQTGKVIGTPTYMSPEQALGSKEVDARSDLWSLGIVLYKAIVGGAPYRGRHGGDLVVEIVNNGPPPIRSSAPWVPPAMAAIVEQALRIERSERFQTADEMVEAIRRVLPEGDVTVRQSMLVSFTPPLEATVTASEAETQIVAELAPARRRPTAPGGTGRRSIALGMAALGLGLSALAVLAWVLSRGGEPSPASAAAPRVSALPPASASVRSDPSVVTVRVRVRPSDAEVSVGGVEVAVVDGVIELSGKLGEVLRIVVVFDGSTETHRVAITDQGPLPPEIGEAPAPSVHPAPAPNPATGRPPAAPAPATKPKARGKLDFSSSFE